MFSSALLQVLRIEPNVQRGYCLLASSLWETNLLLSTRPVAFVPWYPLCSKGTHRSCLYRRLCCLFSRLADRPHKNMDSGVIHWRVLIDVGAHSGENDVMLTVNLLSDAVSSEQDLN